MMGRRTACDRSIYFSWIELKQTSLISHCLFSLLYFSSYIFNTQNYSGEWDTNVPQVTESRLNSAHACQQTQICRVPEEHIQGKILYRTAEGLLCQRYEKSAGRVNHIFVKIPSLPWLSLGLQNANNTLSYQILYLFVFYLQLIDRSSKRTNVIVISFRFVCMLHVYLCLGTRMSSLYNRSSYPHQLCAQPAFPTYFILFPNSCCDIYLILFLITV